MKNMATSLEYNTWWREKSYYIYSFEFYLCSREKLGVAVNIIFEEGRCGITGINDCFPLQSEFDKNPGEIAQW